MKNVKMVTKALNPGMNPSKQAIWHAQEAGHREVKQMSTVGLGIMRENLKASKRGKTLRRG
jgi:hypothetical protein